MGINGSHSDTTSGGLEHQAIAGFIAKRRDAGLQVSSINRQLEVLRRMLKLAMEWGKVEKALPRVEMLRGENHRDRVLTVEEEAGYLKAATAIGENIQESYQRAWDCVSEKDHRLTSLLD